MCDKCYILVKIFEAADSNPHSNYLPIISFIEKMIHQERLELYAGDCPIEEVQRILMEESHYTIRHYLKCKTCNQHFLIGACIRGTPVYRIIDKISGENIDNLWGRYGIYFRKKHDQP